MFHVDKWLYSKISPLRLVTHWIHVFITTDHLLMEDLALQKSVVLQVRIAHPISGSVTIRRLFLNSQQRSSSTYLKWKIVMKKLIIFSSKLKYSLKPGNFLESKGAWPAIYQITHRVPIGLENKKTIHICNVPHDEKRDA